MLLFYLNTKNKPKMILAIPGYYRILYCIDNMRTLRQERWCRENAANPVDGEGVFKVSCNAHNHSLDCDCGFGGNTGGGGFSYSPVASRSVSIWSPGYRLPLASFTIPNATCPVCGAAVFFHQAWNGGRVFFDELGPPWPKHPCTDRASPPAPARLGAGGRPCRMWLEAGWLPVQASSLIELEPTPVITLATEIQLGKLDTLTATGPSIILRADEGPAFWRPSDKPSTLELAFLVYNVGLEQFLPKTVELTLLRRGTEPGWNLLERALAGEAEAEAKIGWELSFARRGKMPDVEPLWAAAWIWFERAADQQHPAAINNLGVMLRDGLGRAADPLTAMDLFWQAADLGLSRACANLAICYEQGLGVEGDTGMAAGLRELERELRARELEPSGPAAPSQPYPSRSRTALVSSAITASSSGVKPGS